MKERYALVQLFRSVGVFFLLLLCFVSTGCKEEAKPAWKPGMPLPRESVKLGVIHVDDVTSSYSLAHDRGLQIMMQQLGLEETQIIRKLNVNDADRLMIEIMMRECIAEGANIIVGTSWGHMDVCEKLSRQYPNVIFVNATGFKHNATNFTNYFGRIYQARYLSGIVAGLKTHTGNIGFVAAMGKENCEVTSGINAFALGVESVRPQARIHVRVTHSWFDPAGERQAAQKLLDSGCDVIAQHCNAPDPQIQAEKAGAWGIGYNSDMSEFAPQAVLASVIWKWETYYIHLVQSVIDGSFTTTPYLGGMKEGMVDITPLAVNITDSEMAIAVEKARAKLDAENGFNVFDGMLKTNDGRVMGTPGGTLSDEQIGKEMHWYYHTVIEH